MWCHQLEFFSGEYCVIAPDLRGFGCSDVIGGTVTMEQFADDLAELLVRLDVTQPVTLCGLSMGGYVAWQFWQRHRERLDRLILCDTRAAADSEQVAAARLETAERVLAEGTGFLAESMVDKLFAECSRSRRGEIVAATRRVIEQASPQGVAAASRGMAARPDMTAELPHIDVPTLVVCGEQDAITGVNEMSELAARIPESQFATVAESGHMAPLENPGAVNALVGEFLKK